MITVVATLKAQVGKEGELRAVLAEMVDAVKTHEPGVVAYSLHASNDDPTAFVFYEQYASPEALEAHGRTDHMRKMGPRLGELLDGRPDIKRLTQIAGV